MVAGLNLFELFAAIVLLVGASARITRLITQDGFPPIAHFRAWWDSKTETTEWNMLFHCHWCLAPWVVLVLGLVGWFSGFHWSWWVFTAWMTLSYASSWVVHHDED